jgi:hypothetical protein
MILIVGVILFAWSMWPTLYQYTSTDTRVNCLTGTKQVRIEGAGWVEAGNFHRLIDNLKHE